MNPAPQDALFHSLLDTLSLLHYCGSCSKQCNNERASVSWAPQPSPCPALPLSKAPRPDGSPQSSLLFTEFVIRLTVSIKATLSQEAASEHYSKLDCNGDGMLLMEKMTCRSKAEVCREAVDVLPSSSYTAAINMPDKIK